MTAVDASNSVAPCERPDGWVVWYQPKKGDGVLCAWKNEDGTKAIEVFRDRLNSRFSAYTDYAEQPDGTVLDTLVVIFGEDRREFAASTIQTWCGVQSS